VIKVSQTTWSAGTVDLIASLGAAKVRRSIVFASTFAQRKMNIKSGRIKAIATLPALAADDVRKGKQLILSLA
jgi:hypothetical protein